ncbi:MAG: aminotransferase class III-fold pyridoxal phosphate-dependent enzyme [Pseudomonadota bacterium]
MNITLEKATETFKKKFKKSGGLCERGSKWIPGGYSRHSLTFGPHAIYVDHGEGQFIYTVDGHRLLDFHNNFSCSVLGHNHPKIRQALLELVPRGFSFGNPMEHEHRLAEIICERIESVEKVIFSCSASESCLSAIRIARGNTGKDKIAKFEGGYHGMGDEFMLSLHPYPYFFRGPATRPIGWPNTAGIPSHIQQNVVILPQNDLESCERILKDDAKDLACVIIELQTSAGGAMVMEKEFVHGLRAITQELGILLIIDETVTLRTFYHGMQGFYGVKPDLTVMGKVIGGGLPIGAVGGQEKYFHMHETGKVYHSGTHHGHPLATAAGIACMEVLDEVTCNRINKMGDRLAHELNTWATENTYPFYVIGHGGHLGYEFTDKPGRVYRSCRDMLEYSNEERMATFAFEMANRDIFPMYRGLIALSEPMNDNDIDLFINTSKELVEGILAAS